jgi:hypothetical protein
MRNDELLFAGSSLCTLYVILVYLQCRAVHYRRRPYVTFLIMAVLLCAMSLHLLPATITIRILHIIATTLYIFLSTIMFQCWQITPDYTKTRFSHTPTMSNWCCTTVLSIFAISAVAGVSVCLVAPQDEPPVMVVTFACSLFLHLVALCVLTYKTLDDSHKSYQFNGEWRASQTRWNNRVVCCVYMITVLSTTVSCILCAYVPSNDQVEGARVILFYIQLVCVSVNSNNHEALNDV